MSYKVALKHGVLATPYGTWNENEEFVPTPTLPREVFQKWLKDGVVVVDEEGPDINEMFDDSDCLTALTRSQLKEVIRLNKLPIPQVNSKWSDDTIRQAIRDVAGFDLKDLKLSEAEATAKV